MSCELSRPAPIRLKWLEKHFPAVETDRTDHCPAVFGYFHATAACRTASQGAHRRQALRMQGMPSEICPEVSCKTECSDSPADGSSVCCLGM